MAPYNAMPASTYQKRVEWKQYHKVSAHDLKYKPHSNYVSHLAAEELNLRTRFAKKYYNGRFDNRHAHWMNELASKVETKVALSLDALIALEKCKRW
jgi:hypothetical protein